ELPRSHRRRRTLPLRDSTHTHDGPTAPPVLPRRFCSRRTGGTRVTPTGATNSSSWSDNSQDRTKCAVIYLRVSTVKQATSGGEVEGYSIPAQRQACRRKAEELGAQVVDEYVDAGASARSA